MNDKDYSEVDEKLKELLVAITNLRWKISSMDERSTTQNKALEAENAAMRECLIKYSNPGRCGCTMEQEYDAVECLSKLSQTDQVKP